MIEISKKRREVTYSYDNKWTVCYEYDDKSLVDITIQDADNDVVVSGSPDEIGELMAVLQHSCKEMSKESEII